MKRTRKLVALFLCAMMMLSLIACSSDSGPSNSPSSGGGPSSNGGDSGPSIAGAAIEVVNQYEFLEESLRALIADFEAETGVKVTLTEYPSSEYENAMKTRMASGEMPDVLETHGWSRLRYGEYLMPVNDEPWYQYQADLARGILTGDSDTAYALMLTSSALGITCNKTTADSIGVDVYAIETLDDFKDACQKAIDAGLVPLVNHASAGDLTHAAGIFTTYEDAISNDMAAQLDGTWDWESFMGELNFFAELLNMGAFWTDRSTMTSTEEIERMASGKSLFYFANSTNYCGSLAELNPDNEYVVIPFPAVSEGAARYIAGGEGLAIGVWKDSPQLEAARAFMQYVADHGSQLAADYGGIPVMTNMEVPNSIPISQAANTMERYPDAVYVNMWDREYMPSGMWSVFGEAVGMLYSDHSPENLVAIRDFLKDNYIDKWAAAHRG